MVAGTPRDLEIEVRRDRGLEEKLVGMQPNLESAARTLQDSGTEGRTSGPCDA